MLVLPGGAHLSRSAPPPRGLPHHPRRRHFLANVEGPHLEFGTTVPVPVLRSQVSPGRERITLNFGDPFAIAPWGPSPCRPSRPTAPAWRLARST
jgi:hypothetical protein